MNSYIKTNVEGLVKDLDSGAILNVNNGALEQYRRQKAMLETSNDTGLRITKVENDVSEIKQLLQQLIKEIKK